MHDWGGLMTAEKEDMPNIPIGTIWC
jgi:hypothetical protein